MSDGRCPYCHAYMTTGGCVTLGCTGRFMPNPPIKFDPLPGVPTPGPNECGFHHDGACDCCRGCIHLRADRDAAEGALKGVSGALCDAGTIPVPSDPMGYADAVRALTKERDALSARCEALEGALRTINEDWDCEGPGADDGGAHDHLHCRACTAGDALLRPAEGEGICSECRIPACEGTHMVREEPSLLLPSGEKIPVPTTDDYAAEMGDGCGTFKDIPEVRCPCMGANGMKIPGYRVHLKDNCYRTIEDWKAAKAARIQEERLNPSPSERPAPPEGTCPRCAKDPSGDCGLHTNMVEEERIAQPEGVTSRAYCGSCKEEVPVGVAFVHNCKAPPEGAEGEGDRLLGEGVRGVRLLLAHFDKHHGGAKMPEYERWSADADAYLKSRGAR
jgi:hypothetical protein